jgi:hypothetical protein
MKKDIGDLHPLDRPKLRRLGELMFEISTGELTTRDPIRGLVGELMICTRDDLSSAGADEVVDRLLALADHRLGADRLGELALAEIVAGDVPWAGLRREPNDQPT